jgi:molecular chaperone HtpG
MSQKYEFNADIGKVLNLVINSIYTNKDIFLRELISNASDAIEKRRYEGIQNPVFLGEGYLPKIDIWFSHDEKILMIRDNGIGMNEEDLKNNLGTIAKSGTQAFIEKVQESAGNSDLIGQFGVGFYSAFMVADEVKVKSKKAGEDKVFLWTSNGQGAFEITDITHEEADFAAGTEIVLHFKAEEVEDYLDKFTLERIIKTYSNHIQTPIEIEHEDGLKKVINDQKSLWLKNPREITEDEYKDFYKNLTHSPDEPFLIIHNKVEGVVEYSSLLFIPSSKPFDLYSPDRKTAVKLYVNRVFITENNKDILPEYLRFVKGIIDSADLPLNISRETFQNNRTIEKIRNSLIKKIFAELKNKQTNEREKYEDFWVKFGNVIKEGLCDYNSDKEVLMDICLFRTTKSGDKWVTMDDYIAGMKTDQGAIYFLTGDETEDLSSNPQLEAFKRRDVEVILLNHTVDDFWINIVIDYKGHDLKNVGTQETQADANPEEEKTEETLSKEDIIRECFKKALGDLIEDVKITDKLVESPVCLSAKSGVMSIRMERYLFEQKQIPKLSPKILEVNPEHKIIEKMYDKYLQNNKELTDEITDLASVLYDGAALSAGATVAKPNEFFNKMNKILEKLS